MDKRALTSHIVSLETLEGLTHAYAQISSNRMKNIRKSVLSNRQFLDDLNGIFKDLRLSYRREVIKLLKEKQKKRGRNKEKDQKETVTFLSHNGKTVSVLLSANTGLYGELVPQTFYSFLKDWREQGTEATIIGKLGLSLFLEEAKGKPYTFFDYPDYGGDSSKLSDIVAHLVQYEKIRLYHGKFVNLIRQEPAVSDLAAETPIAKFDPNQKEEEGDKFLFEPTLEEILVFFETEMFGSIFEQTLKESQLAKFASRMFAMDTAGENIKELLKKMRLEKLRLSHYINNKVQLDALSGSVRFQR
ncbi:MAG TPA: F0F1 ATP synthase subunit gamma [Patescibacteria group bacterium]